MWFKRLFTFNLIATPLVYKQRPPKYTSIAWKNAIYIRKRFKQKANLCYLNTSGDENRYLYTTKPNIYKRIYLATSDFDVSDVEKRYL